MKLLGVNTAVIPGAVRSVRGTTRELPVAVRVDYPGGLGEQAGGGEGGLREGRGGQGVARRAVLG
jgi:hypothetical protein